MLNHKSKFKCFPRRIIKILLCYSLSHFCFPSHNKRKTEYIGCTCSTSEYNATGLYRQHAWLALEVHLATLGKSSLCGAVRAFESLTAVIHLTVHRVMAIIASQLRNSLLGYDMTAGHQHWWIMCVGLFFAHWACKNGVELEFWAKLNLH